MPWNIKSTVREWALWVMCAKDSSAENDVQADGLQWELNQDAVESRVTEFLLKRLVSALCTCSKPLSRTYSSLIKNPTPCFWRRTSLSSWSLVKYKYISFHPPYPFPSLQRRRGNACCGRSILVGSLARTQWKYLCPTSEVKMPMEWQLIS